MSFQPLETLLQSRIHPGQIASLSTDSVIQTQSHSWQYFFPPVTLKLELNCYWYGFFYLNVIILILYLVPRTIVMYWSSRHPFFFRKYTYLLFKSYSDRYKMFALMRSPSSPARLPQTRAEKLVHLFKHNFCLFNQRTVWKNPTDRCWNHLTAVSRCYSVSAERTFNHNSELDWQVGLMSRAFKTLDIPFWLCITSNQLIWCWQFASRGKCVIFEERHGEAGGGGESEKSKSDGERKSTGRL